MTLIDHLIQTSLAAVGYGHLKFGYELFDGTPRVWAYGELARELPAKAQQLLSPDLAREATEAVKRGASIQIVGFPMVGNPIGEFLLREVSGNGLPANERRALAALSHAVRSELVSVLAQTATKALSLATAMRGAPRAVYERRVRGVTVSVVEEPVSSFDLSDWPKSSRTTLLNGVLSGVARPRRYVAQVSVGGHHSARAASGPVMASVDGEPSPFAWRMVLSRAMAAARESLAGHASQMRLAV